MSLATIIVRNGIIMHLGSCKASFLIGQWFGNVHITVVDGQGDLLPLHSTGKLTQSLGMLLLRTWAVWDRSRVVLVCHGTFMMVRSIDYEYRDNYF